MGSPPKGAAPPIGIRSGWSQVRKAGHLARDYVTIVNEAVRYDFRRAPEIVGKVLDARLRYDLGPVDFFLYDLMNRPRSTWREYLREHPHNDKMLRIIHPFETESVVRDKVLASERCVAAGIAIVPILGVVARQRASTGRFPLWNSPDAVLAAMPTWPDEVFVKPVSGSFGEDAMVLRREGDGWRGPAGFLEPGDVAGRLLASSDATGVLVQPRLPNDRRMAGLSCGRGLCTTRVVTALTADGPELFVAAHKMLGSDVIADNFRKGMSGNMVAPVDVHSGRLGVAYGRPDGFRFLLTRHTHHPVTGQPVFGFELPQWDDVKALALKAALAFPELPFLGHDIAITDEGPVFLETNSHWRITFPQLALGGLRTRFRTLIPRLAISERQKAAALAALG